MRIGVHVGVGEGLEAAAAYAAEVGCECMQVFAKSPVRWHGPERTPEEAAALSSALAEHGIFPLVTHTAYLLNLSGPDEALRSRSWRALADELGRAEALGASAVVTHVGTAPDGPEAAAANLSESLSRARSKAETGVRILLENSAGAGSQFLAAVPDFAHTFAALTRDAGSIGVCLDTCHAHAAGLPVATEADWELLLNGLEEATGCSPDVVHANDCVAKLGSRKDRHAWIGDGHIGSDGFAAMLGQPRLAASCAITEMPGDRPMKDAENVRRLKGLRDSGEGDGMSG